MASPARDFRNKAQERWAGAIVHSRGRDWIKHQHPTDPTRFMLDHSVGPLHYGASNDQEIDTAWQADTGAWQYKMLLAEYNAHARNILNVGDIINYSDPTTGENVTFQPLGLNWVDNVTDSRQQLALPQAVTATVDDDTLIWTNGYGTGRHFSWQTDTARLLKVLTIDSAANIPAPTVSNPYLEIEFIVKYSGGLTILVNGQTWNKRDKVTTTSSIEFRDASGNPLWHFRNPLAWDSEHKRSEAGLMQVQRRGATQYVTVRWPKAWVDAAVFPIHLDTTIDVDISATANDTWNAPPYFWSGTELTIGNNGDGSVSDISLRWLLNVAAGSTIDTSYVTLVARYDDAATTVSTTVYREAATNPAAPTTMADFSGRTMDATTVAWASLSAWTANSAYNTPEIKTIIQDCIDAVGWASGQAIQIFIKNNSSTSGAIRRPKDYSVSAADCPALHVEYTAAAGGLPIPVAMHHYQFNLDR